MPLFAICGFIWGAVFGSFADAVADRTLEDQKWWGTERSRCTTCGKVLGALELFPIFSYLIQRGKCKSCGAKIPVECLYTELASGFFYALLWGLRYPLTLSWILGTLVIPLFMIHAITDFKTHMVYDWVSFAIIIPALFFRIFCGFIGYVPFGFEALPGVVGITVVLLLFAIIGWIGMGDIILIAGLGCVTGAVGLIFTIYMAFVLCMIYTIILSVVIGYKTFKYHHVNISELSKAIVPKIRELAFCPWLCLAAYLWIVFYAKFAV